MLAVYLGVRLLYRERSMPNVLGAAALALMVADPKVFLGASFQLTFLAVFLVAAIAVPLLERTTQPVHAGISLIAVGGIRSHRGASSRAGEARSAHDRGTHGAVRGEAGMVGAGTYQVARAVSAGDCGFLRSALRTGAALVSISMGVR
jgi:hypothetical protein